MNLDELLEYPPFIAFTIDSWLMSQQEQTGIGFDIDGAKRLVEQIDREMVEIAAEIEPQLPERPLNKGELASWSLPAKPWKKDGTLSSTMEKWLEKTGAKLHTERDIILDGKVYPIVGGAPTKTTGRMTLSNEADIKSYLLELGWEPTLWNIKRNKDKSYVKDENGNIIKTSPKIQEKGMLCPNLEAMNVGIGGGIARYMILSHRRSVLKSISKGDKGFLNNERLAFDGRLPAGASGITVTHRKTHKCVANLPKADGVTVLGKEIRGLFIAKRPGYVLVGYDASGLEARTEAHYVYSYKGGAEYAKELFDGDIHLKNVLGMSVFNSELAGLSPEEITKDHPRVKPLRDKAKTLKYAVTYGAGIGRVASTLKVSMREAEKIFDSFWEAAGPLTILKDRVLAHWEANGKRKIRALDGRWINVKKKHRVINYLLQSAGAIVVSYAGLFMHKALGGLTTVDSSGMLAYLYKGKPVYRVAEYHDEWVWEVPEELAEEIKEMGERSLSEAGRFLKMKVPIIGEGKIGMSWADIH